jgi:hypothetical protein
LGLAIAIGRNSTSAGTRKIELSMKEMTKSQISAEGRSASRMVQS